MFDWSSPKGCETLNICCHLVVKILHLLFCCQSVHCAPSSGTFPEMRVTLHCASDPFLQTDQRPVGQVFLGPLTAVVVVGSSQSHSHWCESGFEGHQGAQDQGHQPEEEGKSIDQQVGEVVARSIISKTNQDLWHEVPESNGLVVGNVVGLRSHGEWKGFIGWIRIFKDSISPCD